MINMQTQFADFHQSAIKTAIGIANLTVENAQRLVDLNLQSAKAALEDSAAYAKTIAEVKDVQDLAAVRSKAAEASVEKALAYSRNLYDLTSQMQVKVSQLLEEQFNTLNQSVVATMEDAARNAPAGGEMAVTALNASVANTNAAVDTFKRAATEASRLTDTAVESAQRNVENVVKTTGRRKP